MSLFLNNTALTGLGGAFSLGSGVSGHIDYTTIAFNYALFGTTTGGNNNTYLSNTIISNNSEGNHGYSPLSCTGKFNSIGTYIWQWPLILPESGWNEQTQNWTCTLTPTGQRFQDPLLNPVYPNYGCVGPMITVQGASPVGNAGSSCPTTPAFQPLTYFLSNRQPLDRNLFFTIHVGSSATMITPQITFLLALASLFLVFS